MRKGLGLFFLLISFVALGAEQISYADFQRVMSDTRTQTLMATPKFKKIMESYKPGFPQSEAEFLKFQRSIAFWKIKRNSDFQKLISAAASATPLPEATLEEVLPKVKTERERYLEQFMAKEPVPTPTVEPAPEVSSDGDIEKELLDIQKNSEELLKLAQPQDGKIDIEAAKKILNKNMAGKVVDGRPATIMENPDLIVKKMLEPFQKMSEAEIIKGLRDQTKENKFAATAYQYVPKLPIFIAKFLKSKEALPEIAKISVDKKRMMIYFILNIVTIVLGFIMKRLTATQIEFGKQVKNFFFRIFILYSIRVGLLVYFFGQEFKPAADIFMRTFF